MPKSGQGISKEKGVLMQSKQLLLLVLLLSVTKLANANSMGIKVIYGDDNRVDVFESRNALYLDLAQSTAAMIKNDKLKELNDYEYSIEAQTLVERGMCESERFAQQPTAASCSGFLVTENTLVTAGHCIQDEFDCSQSSWVFNYKVEHSEQSEVNVEKSDVYKCVKIIEQKLGGEGQNDHAYIQLDRKVEGRKPLQYRKTGKPSVGDELVVIGHPTGLPTKIADGASVRSVNDVFLVANLDTYGGNSGSAVFNATSGVVEGILVRGDTDYVSDPVNNCRVSNQVPNNGGRGEDVTLITTIEALPKEVIPPKVKPRRKP